MSSVNEPAPEIGGEPLVVSMGTCCDDPHYCGVWIELDMGTYLLCAKCLHDDEKEVDSNKWMLMLFGDDRQWDGE